MTRRGGWRSQITGLLGAGTPRSVNPAWNFLGMSVMIEPVRLVIWELDETFWLGTLSEGGIRQYIRENHDLIIDLARRGIVTSICSNNDYALTRQVLEEYGIWEYFVFPSIDWTPKAPRLARIIEQAQLRAPAVLFIDDNARHRAEALHYLPGLQVAGAPAIGAMKDDARFRGKSDRALTRLKQCKLLESRAVDVQASGNDNTDFLRESQIRVTIDYDVEANIDRAIELINKTNQLNFTKRRLPEDNIQATRQIIANALKPFYAWAGLVRVSDKYDDYGIVGFFVGGDFRKRSALYHFCFSCRTLGMGVEKWVYQYLGKPKLQVAGDVVIDIFDGKAVDWINPSDTAGGSQQVARGGGRRLRFRGGSEINAIAHYEGHCPDRILVESSFGWNELYIRNDYSHNLVMSLAAGSPARRVISELGLDVAFQTSLFDPCEEDTIIVLSLWADQGLSGLRHRTDGFVIGLNPLKIDFSAVDRLLRTRPDADLGPVFEAAGIDPESRTFLDGLLRRIARDFEFAGTISEQDFKSNLNTIFARTSARMPLVFILQPERIFKEDAPVISPRATDLRRWSAEVASLYPHVYLIDVETCIASDSEIFAHNQFDRRVYLRLHQRLRELISAIDGGGSA
jgi:FkbH-like protein